MNIKRNILIYLDSYPMVISLSPEQRGWLFTALLVYGDRLSRDENITLEEIMEQFPKLSPETRLVCGFMGGNILRDTQKWLSRQQSRSKSSPGTKYPPVPNAQKDARAREDMERMRQLMEQFHEEE